MSKQVEYAACADFDANRDPETMSPNERRDEVACILARGLVRAVRHARRGTTAKFEKGSESCRDGLELDGRSSLTVAPQPGRPGCSSTRRQTKGDT